MFLFEYDFFHPGKDVVLLESTCSSSKVSCASSQKM